MKGAKKLIIQLLSAVFLVVLFTIPAQAASCTCEQSSKPHDASHSVDYVSNGASGHMKLCFTCMMNGHTETCAQVILDSNEAHDLSYSGSGANRVAHCTRCDYEMTSCPHTHASYRVITNVVGGTHTDSDACLKYCDDCEQIVETKNHNWKYEQLDQSEGAWRSKHRLVCKDCGYNYYSDKTTHTWKYISYKKPGVPQNPVTSLQENTSAALDHTAHAICTECGLETDFVERHTFSGNTCTKCNLTKDILPKVSKLKGKQKGKSKHKSSTLRAQWVWTGTNWTYYKSRKVTTHSYKITVNWKKNSKAYGYYCTLDKPNTKQSGTYVTNYMIPKWNVSNGRDVPTRKNSATLSVSSTKKLKKVAVYVAPISKYGFIGKWKKVTVKVK